MTTHTEAASQAAARARPALLAKLVHVIREHAPRRLQQRSDFSALDNPAPPPPRRRGRPKGTPDWIAATHRLSDDELAELILSECLHHWTFALDGKPPSAVTIAKSIGGRLRTTKGKRVRVGRAVLYFAELAGIITPIKKFWTHTRFELTDDTLSSLEPLYRMLLESQRGRDYGVLNKPTSRAPAVRRKRDQKLTPFRPAADSIPARAALRIHRTAWRVDPWMRNVIEHILAERAPLAFGGKGRAHEHRKMLRDYGSALFALNQAQSYTEPFYFNVRWDHRGRLHHVGGALTYSGGSDAARAMLQFAEAKPVSAHGRQWLARHLINQYRGEESRKTPLGAEVEWINLHRELVDFTAADPIGTRAWENANPKSQFRFIAACRAWSLAEQNQPVALPVAVDASTSVLQHMALLLRDADLAARVNLWPGERRDFYQEVAAECQMSLTDWLGDHEWIAARGQQLSRSYVKRVAMTRFYGQTFKTAVDTLVAADPETDRNTHSQNAVAIRVAAETLAPRAEALYKALRRVALQLTERNEPIRWTTPSGWQCVQDRRELKPVEGKAYLPDGTSVPYTERVISETLYGLRQANALPANLIQSLDASLLHIALADRLPARVSSLATAHDSFGTHADDVPVLLHALMAALGDMYDDADVLAVIWARWQEIGVTVPLPARGEWDERFLQGKYAFC